MVKKLMRLKYADEHEPLKGNEMEVSNVFGFLKKYRPNMSVALFTIQIFLSPDGIFYTGRDANHSAYQR